jgi:hypothetical protein
MEFNDQDLKLVLNRALRSVLIATVVGIPIIWVAWGWRSALMFVIGGAIAATGIVEWRQIMMAVITRLDAQAKPRPLGPVLFWFFTRIGVAAAVLCVSLRSLDGKVAALILGIALAFVALFIEAIRLFRGWTA